MTITELDDKDNKILRILTENARMPLKRIAKKVRVSREVVDYRIRRLEKMGIISCYVAKLDMTKFCQNAYGIFLRLTNISQTSFEKLIKFFVNSPLTMWTSTMSGEWDMVTSFLTRNSSDLNNFLKSLETVAGKNLKEYGLLTYIKEIKNTFEDLFPPKKRKIKKETFVMKLFSNKSIELNEKDKKLIILLSKDAKLTNKELSKHVKLTEEGVRQRIKNLQKIGVIRGFRALIDVYKLNLEIYYVLMKFNRVDDKIERDLEIFFENNPNVYYCARVVGRYDLIACIIAKNRIHFHKILSNIRNQFSDNLKDFSTNIIFEEHKHTYIPVGILN